MKTSNILLLTALLVLLFTLGAYNMALKTQYTSGEYKNPLQNHTLLNFKDFDEIDVRSGHFLSIKVEPSDQHEVYLQNTSNERIHITQDGNRLNIEVSPESDGRLDIARQGPFNIIIRVPYVKKIRTDAMYMFNGEARTTQNQPRYPDSYGVTVEGLAQDSLMLEVENGSNILLRKSEIGFLQAIAGRNPNSESRLQLMSSNKVQQADIAILNKGQLVMQDVAIPQLSYSLSDSAKVELSGASLAIIRK
ncbi:DUF2807 domain-containing protein [uncultured Pontibacter sp.]|uniref:DUF2807 domain-containing protein n=1 Tax=uncultured Pontibacter sp. TaxID=453356 RepID=UPI002604192A|nr:DUF2807 domain-containing protein [uncultured Pontibacter sp.]